MNSDKRQNEHLSNNSTTKKVISLTEINRRLNQYDNQIFKEQYLCQSNCFNTSGFDDCAFSEFANNRQPMNKHRYSNKMN